jgi:HD-GYP domain-containing protein (c-di-GMP phosphodiesterase class II)
MRLVSVESLKPGMRLAKNIYNDNGVVLLAEHAELTQPIIDRLRSYGLRFLYVQDERTDDLVIRDLISETTRTRAIQELKSAFRMAAEEHSRKRGLTSIQLGKKMKDLLTSIMDELSDHREAMIMMSHVSVTDQYLYDHSLNVCMYAVLLGMSSRFDEEQLYALGLGSLLHDIGKLTIPGEILHKPGRLSDEEFEVIKTHTETGFQILKGIPNVPLVSAHCAYQHHERLDGSGYPRGIREDEIHEFAKLIGVCDVYDALTSHRVYRKAMLPHEAMEILYAAANTQFDERYVNLFRSKVMIYPIGMTVRLNTGETGVVVDMNVTSPHRPVIRILEDANGQPMKGEVEIDLSKHLHVMIDSVL